MLLIYTLVVVLLGTVHFVLRRRVASLEKKFTRVASQAGHFARQTLPKEGNGKQSDPLLVAKRQYELGRLVQQRDRLEARHHVWLGRTEKFGRLLTALRGWKGRTLPYTFGALDVYGVFHLIDNLGLRTYVSPQMVLDYVRAMAGM